MFSTMGFLGFVSIMLISYMSPRS